MLVAGMVDCSTLYSCGLTQSSCPQPHT